MLNLTEREMNTVLAALRFAQADMRNIKGTSGFKDMTFFEKIAPLDCNDIDRLCEDFNLDRLNCEENLAINNAIERLERFCGYGDHKETGMSK